VTHKDGRNIARTIMKAVLQVLGENKNG
jgi:hypothetical protein